MEFDKSRVYTMFNADDLQVGDLVYLADSAQELRLKVTEDSNQYVSELTKIYNFNEGEECRFVDEYDIPYSFAYFVCPERNAAAFKAWHEGKKIEMEYAEPDENESPVWKLFENENPDWYEAHYRPVPEYRPFDSLDELTAEFVKRFQTKVPFYALPLIWVKSSSKKYKSERYLITGYEENGQLVAINNNYYSLSVLFYSFTFLDGSPCGVKE